MATNPKHFLTEEEYLEFELKSEFRHEFFQGEIFAMTGGRREHARIVMNLGTSLDSQLRGRNCNTYSENFRINVPVTGLYAYPDIVVTCGEEKLKENVFDTLLNPALIIEVLSESTEGYDRGLKFQNYQGIETLREYLLVSQFTPRIEHFIRQADSSWNYTEVHEISDSIKLPSIECALTLKDVYYNVEFKPRYPQRT
jgi:Uma2 family endonuclease